MTTRFFMEVDNDIGINKIAIDIDGATPVSKYTLVSVGIGDDYIGYTYDSVAETWSEPTVSVEQLRATRDGLLSSSDDMIIRYREHEYLKANNSNTRFDGKGYDNIAGHLTENQYHDWLVYRQDLRDLPDGYTPVASPTYPNKPS